MVHEGGGGGVGGERDRDSDIEYSTEYCQLLPSDKRMEIRQRRPEGEALCSPTADHSPQLKTYSSSG